MQEVIFDYENPTTVHDVLWSWSTGHLSARDAIKILSLDNHAELYEAAIGSDVPIPGKPNERDIKLADEFVAAITFAA